MGRLWFRLMTRPGGQDWGFPPARRISGSGCEQKTMRPELRRHRASGRQTGPAATAPRLLLAADDDAVRESLALALGSEGWAVETSATGPAAVNLYAVGRFDAVVVEFGRRSDTGPRTLETLCELDPCGKFAALVPDRADLPDSALKPRPPWIAKSAEPAALAKRLREIVAGAS